LEEERPGFLKRDKLLESMGAGGVVISFKKKFQSGKTGVVMSKGQ
jgi:hypothetical protein